MPNILVTGSSGYLGSKVVDILAAKGWEIFGIDVREPANASLYRNFVRGSVTDSQAMGEAFRFANPDVAVHLAFVVKSTHDVKLEESVAVDGARNFLKCCADYNVRKAVFMSSVAAYGAHDDNDVPLTESSAIRGVEGYGYSRLKAKTDLMAQEFMRSHEGCCFTLLRPCLFVGPNTDNNFFDVLKYPLVPQIVDRKGVRDPEFQFIHEDDMAACLAAAVEKPVCGVFNIAADGTVPFSELVKMCGKRRIAVPSWIIYPMTRLLWRLHLVTSPPAQLDFIRYPWIADASRMKRELYSPTQSSVDAFEEYVRARVR